MEKPPLFAERTKIEKSPVDPLVEEEGLPPVVARMVVEIRSDGTRTIARGALEDLQNGERVSLQAGAGSPIELATQLTKALSDIPILAKGLAGGAAKDLARLGTEKIKERLAPLSALAKNPLSRFSKDKK